MSDSIERLQASVRNSKMLRLISIWFLALLLQIPIMMIGKLVQERQQRRQGAVEEISSKWGNAQTIAGPALVVPYTARWTEVATDGKQTIRSESRHAIFLPENLDVRGSIDTETRKRGIYSVPVYALGLTVEANFAPPDFSELGIEPAEIAWDRAHLAVGISDVRAIQQEVALSWDDRKIAFLPGTGAFTDAGPGIHADLGVTDAPQNLAFSFSLALNGSVGVYLTPFGRTTKVELQSDHGHPSFQGNWLPTERSVEGSAFRAAWSIPSLGRNYPQAWNAQTPMREAIVASRFGVDLVNPVDQGRMADRSVKYAALFIVLTFTSVWLVEVLTGVRVHPIQYLMLGGALCLFYLLELSLSEHLGFALAYTVACTSVIGMVGAYCRSALGSTSRAMVVASGVAVLYTYLYILLVNEDYALLVGSVGLFAILAAIMYVTRRVDWYAVGQRPLLDSEPS